MFCCFWRKNAAPAPPDVSLSICREAQELADSVAAMEEQTVTAVVDGDVALCEDLLHVSALLRRRTERLMTEIDWLTGAQNGGAEVEAQIGTVADSTSEQESVSSRTYET